MNEKRFSIVVCTYNGARYLRQTLSAILELKDLHDKVQKVIVVDNNSTDSTKEIIHEYLEKDPIFIYEFEKRQGLSYAREHAVNVDTEWVVYVDDDNVLDRNWLIELENTINENEKLGVINGAVIATPEGRLTEAENNILKVMYRNLACTHLDEPSATDAENLIPMGAGMCIRVDALKVIFQEGWLKLKGRSGKKLSSGEDTELSSRVFAQGYKYKCNYKMKLFHIIPKNRLTEEYTIKLIDGLVEGRIEYLRSQKDGKIQCLVRKIKYTFISIISYFMLINSEKGTERYWKYRIDAIQAKAFLRVL